MLKPIIYPYKLGSHSARVLAVALGTRCVRPNGTYKQKLNHLVINWGNSVVPNWINNGRFLNPVYGIQRAQNKLTTFAIFKEHGNVPHPTWTTNIEEAKQWTANGLTVMCRKLLRSHSGNGIVVSHSTQELVNAPLYVQYKKKKKEFRVHVFLGEVIDVQQKRRKAGEEVNTYIRSFANGWVYAREDLVEPQGLRELALKAVAALELDFGAVDIIWNAHENQCYCLEVNTAPGLEGTTLEKYTAAMVKACTN